MLKEEGPNSAWKFSEGVGLRKKSVWDTALDRAAEVEVAAVK